MRSSARSIFILLFAAALIGLLALPARAAPLSAPTSPGTTNLVAWWSMNEASGVRYDSHGANHLTDNNTVAYAAGVVGNASYAMYANGEYLTIADNDALSMGNIDFTMCGWIQMLGQKNETEIVYKWVETPAVTHEYLLKYKGTTDRFTFGVSATDNSASILVVANTLGSPALNTWYFVCGWHNAADDTINIQVNNGGVDSIAHSAGVNSSSANVLLSRPRFATVNIYQDETFIYKRILTADERTWLYNSGAGRAYSELIAPPTNTPTATRTATHTAIPPTATNTPTATRTATHTAIPPTATNTPLPTATNTPLPTATNTPLPTATNTPLPTATNTPLYTDTATDTPLPSDTPTATGTETFTPTNTFTPSNTPTITNTPTATGTPGNLATAFWQNAISYGEAAQVSATALLCLVVTLGLLAWLVITTLQKRRK